MEPVFQESRPILPRNLSILLSATLAVTVAAMSVTKLFYYTEMSMVPIIIFAVMSVAVIILALSLRFTTSIYDDRMEIVHSFRRTVIPKDDIVDTKTGELDIIRNYSDWTLKGVKYRTFTAIGEDLGIGMKVKGMKVYYISSTDPVTMASLLPKKEE